ncbi:hypothetical protein TNCV_2367261 [Trichonephila clavipes]|nr:hypothetical protein TNCV_2367231 [Trichonephila clavipes]GFU15754.1 hypothetical protein TNCV_2367261 [Trichonephila clavipes]
MAPSARQLGCVLACYAPIGRRRRSRETLVLRIRGSEGRVVNTSLVFKRVLLLETGKRPRERENKIREKSEEDRRKKGQESPGEREREARLEWRKRAESGNWSEKDNERRWR